MSRNNLVLGLDIGVRSVGWAVLDLANRKIVRTGVRIFDAGVEGVVEKGRDVSRAAARREARLRRRQTERKVRRMVKLALILQEAGLLPAGNIRDPQARHEFISKLDQGLGERYAIPEQAVLPYVLRTRALDEKLEPYELGRALYHLAQRRGFKSNRKSATKETDKLGKVKGTIKSLGEEMKAAGARTLGEFLYNKKVDDPKAALRGAEHYTHRDMYKGEFERIWEEQKKHYPNLLTDNLMKEIGDETAPSSFFYQRPLKSQKHLIGKCQLEPGQHRAPRALRIAQRFRMLETVNRLKIIDANGSSQSLTPEQRTTLLAKLDCTKRPDFGDIRKWLKLDEHIRFNLETEGVKSVCGNKTGDALSSRFTRKRWSLLSETEKERICETFYAVEDEEELVRIAIQDWGLDEDRARKVADAVPEDGYFRFSEKALNKLMPLLESGSDVETAIRSAYPGSRIASEKRGYLPHVLSTVQLRNPAVVRALTEVRKVVNAVIREYGLPGRIRVELARDMKRNREERQNISKDISQRTKERESAREALTSGEFGLKEPTARDIEKYLLWRESGPMCVYCGKTLGGSTLFTGETHVDHIIPRKLSLDNSFVNKVVCCSKCNSEKADRTPHEAFSHDQQRWGRIQERVGKLQSEYRREKLKRVVMTREEAEEYYTGFTKSQLNDTKYASREAGNYLGLLYGGRVDADGKLTVQVTKGGITSEMRNALQMNSIPAQIGDWIFDPDEKRGKNRGDHRQHAVDALAIALSSPDVVKLLSDAYASSDTAGKQAKKEIWSAFAAKAAWPSFLDDAKSAVEGVAVSHRPRRRVRGKLFDDNPVSPEAVTRKSGDIGESYIQIGKDKAHLRLLKSGGNHHIEVWEARDKKGRVTWKGRAVTLYEAYQRVKAGQPVVQRDHGPGTKFKFTLAVGDTIELTEGGKPKLYQVCSVWKVAPGSCRVQFKPHNDATQSRGPALLLNPLRTMGCKKVEVPPQGEKPGQRHCQND